MEASTQRAMSTAKNITETSAEIQIPWFKWEFLRRNEDYQKDFAAFETRFGPWFQENGYWWSRKGPPYSRRAWFFFCTQIAPSRRKSVKAGALAAPLIPHGYLTRPEFATSVEAVSQCHSSRPLTIISNGIDRK